jgi:type VI secretion system Hcp family effector
MANHGYMTITGKAQGLISAGCSTQDSIGNKCQAAHTDEIMVLSFSHNMANVGNINKPTHNPIIITKNVDKSSPLLAQALASRESIECKISFYRVSAYGMQEKFYTIEIKDGIVADLTLDMPHVTLQSDTEPQEHLALRYREITWTQPMAPPLRPLQKWECSRIRWSTMIRSPMGMGPQLTCRPLPCIAGRSGLFRVCGLLVEEGRKILRFSNTDHYRMSRQLICGGQEKTDGCEPRNKNIIH